MSSWNPWDDGAGQYVWAIVCKNRKVHDRQNISSGHKILLAETDEFEPLPVTAPLTVKCDECREEYDYDPSDAVRVEMEPASNKPHPLFSGNRI